MKIHILPAILARYWLICSSIDLKYINSLHFDISTATLIVFFQLYIRRDKIGKVNKATI